MLSVVLPPRRAAGLFGPLRRWPVLWSAAGSMAADEARQDVAHSQAARSARKVAPASISIALAC